MADNRNQLKDDLRGYKPQIRQQTGALPQVQPQAGLVTPLKPILEKRRLVERLIEHFKSR